MSKYYKAEDVLAFLSLHCPKDMWEYQIADLPTIEVGGLIDRRCFIGKWKDHYYPHFEVAGIECSVCGKDVPYWSRHNEIPKYCPNCGVRMEIEE